MRKLLIIFCCLYAGSLPAQILYVTPGTDFTVKGGTDLYMDSLVLTPSSDFILNGNTLTKNSSLANPALAGMNILRVYNFNNITAPFDGTVRFYYQDGAQLNGLAEEDLRLHIYNGTQWSRYNTGFTSDPVNNYVLTTSVGNISLNEITLASSSSVLPLKWLGISAMRNAATIKINWSALQDANSTTFIVEKSANSRQWAAVSPAIAALQGTGTKQYTTTDYDYEPGIVYYRIQAFDRDGSSSYSSVAKVPAQKSITQVSVYPNPLVNQFSLQYTGTSALKELQLLDANGTVVQTWKTIQPVYNIQRMPAGTYTVRLLCADGSIQTQSLTKL